MNISFQAAANAYSNATSVGTQNTKTLPSPSDNVGSVGNHFGNMVTDSISDTISNLRSSEQVGLQALNNKADITDVVNAMTKAELNLKSMVGIRDKLISAFQEIMRMPI